MAGPTSSGVSPAGERQRCDVNAYNNLVLADPNSSTSNGTTQIIRYLQPGDEQQWELVAAGQSANIEASNLVNASSQQVLDDPDFSRADGTPMDQWDYNGGSNQTWTLNPLADGNYVIVNGFNQKVLDDPAGSTADGTNVIQYWPDGGKNQEWTLVPVSDGNYLIVNLASGDCSWTTGASTAQGQSIDLWQPDGGANQEWTLFDANAGLYSSPVWSGYVAATNLGNPQANSVSAVQGDWTVPTVTGPSSGFFDTSIWVGIDGYNASTVEQLGTDQQVVNGTPVYNAWWRCTRPTAIQGVAGRSSSSSPALRSSRAIPSKPPSCTRARVSTTYRCRTSPRTNRSASLPARLSIRTPSPRTAPPSGSSRPRPTPPAPREPAELRVGHVHRRRRHHQQCHWANRRLVVAVERGQHLSERKHYHWGRVPVGYDLGPERYTQ